MFFNVFHYELDAIFTLHVVHMLQILHYIYMFISMLQCLLINSSAVGGTFIPLHLFVRPLKQKQKKNETAVQKV